MAPGAGTPGPGTPGLRLPRRRLDPGVQYHPSQVGRILKRYKWSRQTPLRRAIVFVDETGCYLLPLVVKTYAPRGQTPVLRALLSRDHLSVISGIIHHGWLHARIQDRPFRGRDAARFLGHLTTQISVRLRVIWDGSPIHRCQEVKAFLASTRGRESIWSSCRPTPLS